MNLHICEGFITYYSWQQQKICTREILYRNAIKSHTLNELLVISKVFIYTNVYTENHCVLWKYVGKCWGHTAKSLQTHYVPGSTLQNLQELTELFQRLTGVPSICTCGVHTHYIWQGK